VQAVSASIRGVIFVVVAVCLALASALEGAGQTFPKTNRIAFLSPASGNSPGTREAFDELKKALQGLGYIEGRNLVIDARWSGGDPARLSSMAVEIVGLKPDVILVSTTPVTAAAMRATSTIPIVMVYVSDPVRSGLVASLARPGGNVTGVANLEQEVVAKQVQLLHELQPNARRFAVLMSDNPVHPPELKVAQVAAANISSTILSLTVGSSEELEGAFAAMKKEGVKGVIAFGGPPQTSMSERIAELALKDKVATVFPHDRYVEAGGLMSYAPSGLLTYKLAAGYIDKIVKGAKPADLPVQQPTELELVINLRTARALGLTIPQSLLLRANRIIQ
jgi:putative ABC transport system substrate-binding protein